jgi:transcriptional regulator with XRE-family HTH domain
MELKMINEKLKLIRKELQLNQKEFSQRLDIPIRTYQEYEKGNMKIPHTFLESLSEQFKINANWILTGQGEMFIVTPNNQKSINGNNIVISENQQGNIIFNELSDQKKEKSILSNIMSKLNNIHDDRLLNYIDTEITALVERIQVKKEYGSTFGG